MSVGIRILSVFFASLKDVLLWKALLFPTDHKLTITDQKLSVFHAF